MVCHSAPSPVRTLASPECHLPDFTNWMTHTAQERSRAREDRPHGGRRLAFAVTGRDEHERRRPPCRRGWGARRWCLGQLLPGAPSWPPSSLLGTVHGALFYGALSGAGQPPRAVLSSNPHFSIDGTRGLSTGAGVYRRDAGVYRRDAGSIDGTQGSIDGTQGLGPAARATRRRMGETTGPHAPGSTSTSAPKNRLTLASVSTSPGACTQPPRHPTGQAAARSTERPG